MNWSYFPGCWCRSCQRARRRMGIPRTDLRHEYGRPIELEHRMSVELAGGRCVGP